MSDTLSEKLGQEPAEDVALAVWDAANESTRLSGEVVEEDRKETVAGVMRFLALYQDQHGVSTWSARDAIRRELLAATEEGRDG